MSETAHPDLTRLRSIVHELEDALAAGQEPPEISRPYFDIDSAVDVATARAEAMLGELERFTGPFVEPTRSLFLNAFVAVFMDGITLGAAFERRTHQ